MRPDLSLDFTVKGQVRLTVQGLVWDLAPASALHVKILRLIQSQCASPESLKELAINFNGVEGLRLVLTLMDQLTARGLLAHQFYFNGALAFTVCPLSRPLQIHSISADNKYQLSRFVILRIEEKCMVAESPLASGVFKIADARCWDLLYSWRKPASADDLTRSHPNLTPDYISDCGSVLVSLNLLVEKENDALDLWEWQDLQFHSVTRGVYPHKPLGSLPRFPERDPLPALRASLGFPVIPLPDPQKSSGNATWEQVLEMRRSCTSFNVKPVALATISKLLYSAAKIKEQGKNGKLELLKKPLPSPGGLHSLEIYLLAARCGDLVPALYRYQAKNHQLELICDWNKNLESLLRESAFAMQLKESVPPALLLLASRFGRVQWKYQSIAYSLILKEAGVLLGALHLTATALDLSSCILGAGNSPLFNAATGLDPYAESTVAEIAIGYS